MLVARSTTLALDFSNLSKPFGWEHHYALMYGDRTDELTAVCRNMDIDLTLVK